MVPAGHGPLGLLPAPGDRQTCTSALVSSGVSSPGPVSPPCSGPGSPGGPGTRRRRPRQPGLEPRCHDAGHWPLPPEEPSRERGRLGEATRAAAVARGPVPRARARAPARRSPNFPAARARYRRVEAQVAAQLPSVARPPDLPSPAPSSRPPRLSPSSRGRRPAQPHSVPACFLSPLLRPTVSFPFSSACLPRS